MNASSFERRQRRAKDVKIRSAVTLPAAPSCRIVGCGQPTRAGTNTGLNRLYCRRHEDHFQRHGSYVRGSFTGKEIAPLRATALAWIKANRDVPRVAATLRSIGGLLDRAGSPVDAFRLRGLSPEDRAKATLARVREEGTNKELILATWLAVELATSDDAPSSHSTEFRQVQAAKLVHRMASGAHRRWERQRPNGTIEVTELHRYPASRGRVLRHLGHMIQQTAELVVDHHMDELLSFKRKRDEVRMGISQPARE